MLSDALLVAVLAAFLAGAAGGFTGFGISVILVPLLLLTYDPATVVAINAVLSVVIAAAVAWDSWREADRRVVLALLALALPGLGAGAEILRVVEPSYVQLTAGVLVVVAAVLFLRGDIVRLPAAETRWGTAVVGLASGALASSTGLSGPPVALLLDSRGLSARVFRASIALYFLGLDLALLAVLAVWGHLEPGQVPLTLLLVPATLIGKTLGTAFFGRVSQKAFRVVVLGTVVLTGALGVTTAVRASLS